MAEQTRRNSGGSQPISQHPLFPAIVALWFGALAGLSSLALKPALLESLVVSAGIDSIIPMAAPPLGTTTRILLALAMTGLGGVIGALLARRIARPAPTVRERRRGAGGNTKAAGAETVSEGTSKSNFTGRRRALALQEEGVRNDFADHAPVPGHEPGILNVSEFALDGFEESALQHADQAAQDDLWVGAEAELDADADIDSTEAFSAPALPEGAQIFSPLPEEPAAISLEAATAVEEEDPRGLNHQLFERYTQQINDRTERARTSVPSRLFDSDSPASNAEAAPGFELLPRMNLGDWGSDDDDTDDADTAGMIGEAAPLFPTRESLRNANQPKPEIVQVAPEGDDDGMGDLVAFAADGTAPDTEAEFETIAFEQAPEAYDSRPDTAAERISSSELGELSQLELLERLALAMASRREEVQARRVAEEARAQAEADAAAAETAILIETAEAAEPESSDIADSEDAFPGAPDAEFVPEATHFETPRLEMTPLDVEPLSFEAPRFEASGHGEEPEGAEQVLAATPINRLPAALRPVGYEDFDDTDDGLPGYIPPRHIGMAGSANPLADMVEDEPGEADDDETRVLEEGYSSLLNLSRPGATQHEFVRIEEPESDEIEPVVIFPGEEVRSAGAPFSGPAPVKETEPQSATAAPAAHEGRLFDAPAKANAEETERALRAALATLQRMSGAA